MATSKPSNLNAFGNFIGTKAMSRQRDARVWIKDMKRQNHQGFTLFELLVVITRIACP